MAEILEWMWRSKDQHTSGAQTLELLDPREAIRSLIDVWQRGASKLSLAENSRCLTLLVLSCADDASGAGAGAGGGGGDGGSLAKKLLSGNASRRSSHSLSGRRSANADRDVARPPRNPVLVALKLSAFCAAEEERLEMAGRRQKAVRVHMLKGMFELVALGLLEGAQVASEEARGDNGSIWSRRKARINPALGAPRAPRSNEGPMTA